MKNCFVGAAMIRFLTVMNCVMLGAFVINTGCVAGAVPSGLTNLSILKNNGATTISACINQQCVPASVPYELQEQINEGYELATADINADGVTEIAATSSGVNRCTWFYVLNMKTSSLVSFSPVQEPLCNYKMQDGYVISSYRDAAVWNENIYKQGQGRLALIAKDHCVGCGEIYRSLYNTNPVERMVVTDKPSYFDRVQISTQVSAPKASLFNSPNEDAITKMYLINGDKVVLVDYSDNGDTWYQVAYSRKGKAPLIKWVRCKDLAICQQAANK